MSWHRKHLLDIERLSAEEITTVLDTAREFKAVGERDIKKVPALQGKTIVNFFVEPSTRTRVSFELSAKRLSADIINFAADASSFQKGESLKDTARTLEALNADIIIIRHKAAGAPHFLSRFLNAHVINAGDGAHEHPTQALLELHRLRTTAYTWFLDPYKLSFFSSAIYPSEKQMMSKTTLLRLQKLLHQSFGERHRLQPEIEKSFLGTQG